MQKYKFTYMVEVSVELLTDDKELVKQAEEKSGVKLTYENLETEMGEMILECLADLADDVDIAVQPVKHGHWCDRYKSGTPADNGVVSSCCDMWNERKTDFCPHYGAKMDGGEK